MLRSATWTKIDSQMAMRKMCVSFNGAGFDVSEAIAWATMTIKLRYLA